MQRTNYIIEITLKADSVPVKTLYQGEMVYSGGADEVTITSRSIRLECGRSRSQELDELLTDSNSTIVEQITKSVCFFAATTGEMPALESIEIERINGRSRICKKYPESELVLPTGSWKETGLLFPGDAFRVMFHCKERSSFLMVAAANWVKAMAEKEQGARFSGLWRCYNTLYRYITNKSGDDFSLRHMSDFIKSNVSLFPLSLGIVRNWDKRDLRELLWRKLILNDYANEKQTLAYTDFILRNHDWRLNDIFFDTLGYRQKFLKRTRRNPENNKQIQVSGDFRGTTLYDEVMRHLSTYSPAKQEYDMVMASVQDHPEAVGEFNRELELRLKRMKNAKSSKKEAYAKKAYDDIIGNLNADSAIKAAYGRAMERLREIRPVKQVRDEEVLAFMVNKYIYFIRNKLFHGERIDPTFKLVADKDLGNIGEMNKLLSTYLLELFSANSAFEQEQREVTTTGEEERV